MTGVGALYLRRRPRVRVVPVQSGGGQERGIRSGTVPTPLAVGLGAACEVAQHEMDVSMMGNRPRGPGFMRPWVHEAPVLKVPYPRCM